MGNYEITKITEINHKIDWDKEFKTLKAYNNNGVKADLYSNFSYGELLIKNVQYDLKIDELKREIIKYNDKIKEIRELNELLITELSLIRRKIYGKDI